MTARDEAKDLSPSRVTVVCSARTAMRRARRCKWETGDPSGHQACQPSLNDAENEMAISAGNAKHRMEPFGPIATSRQDALGKLRSGVTTDSQEAVACRQCLAQM